MSLKLLKDEALAEVSGGGYASSFTKGMCSPITGFGKSVDNFCSSNVNGPERVEIVSGGVSKIAVSALIAVGVTAGAKKLISYAKSKNLLKK